MNFEYTSDNDVRESREIFELLVNGGLVVEFDLNAVLLPMQAATLTDVSS
jgi:hypothetical protein